MFGFVTWELLVTRYNSSSETRRNLMTSASVQDLVSEEYVNNQMLEADEKNPPKSFLQKLPTNSSLM